MLGSEDHAFGHRPCGAWANRSRYADGLCGIHPWAFANSSLQSISVPSSVTYSIRLCEGCTKLETANIEGTCIGSFDYYGCSLLSSVNISRNVASIGEYAFGNCKALKQISIPYTVNEIGDNAFDGAEDFEAMYLNDNDLRDDPPLLGENVFNNHPNPQSIIFYIKKGTKEKYLAAENWKDFNPEQFVELG